MAYIGLVKSQMLCLDFVVYQLWFCVYMENNMWAKQGEAELGIWQQLFERSAIQEQSSLRHVSCCWLIGLALPLLMLLCSSPMDQLLLVYTGFIAGCNCVGWFGCFLFLGGLLFFCFYCFLCFCCCLFCLFVCMLVVGGLGVFCFYFLMHTAM